MQRRGATLPESRRVAKASLLPETEALSATAVSASFFESSNLMNKKKEFDATANAPFSHAVFDNLIDPQVLHGVKREMFGSIHATHKETDIYRVFQTGDLANLDGLGREEQYQLRHLHALRNSLYSDKFRNAISQITGCGRLSGVKTDMSANIYRKGCHLLCHDDAIGTRSISFILYLPDETPSWSPSEGGALELYPSVGKGTPANSPSVRLCPRWNRLAIFRVIPGVSFHSVQEVVSDRTRPSIQGWFHFPTEEEEREYEKAKTERLASNEDVEEETKVKMLQQAHMATLKQLEMAAESAAADYHFHTFSPSCPPLPQLSSSPSSSSSTVPSTTDLPKDLVPHVPVLSQWINPEYLQLRSIESIKKRFSSEASITLVKFLKKSVSDEILEVCRKEDERDGLRGGLARGIPADDAGYESSRARNIEGDLKRRKGEPAQAAGWQERGSPIYRRHMGFVNDNSINTIRAQEQDSALRWMSLLNEFFASEAFAAFSRAVTPLTLTAARVETRRFRPGLDYTLATALSLPSSLPIVSSLSPSAASSSPVDKLIPISTGEAVLQATLTFVDEEEKWQSDELGGYVVYMQPDSSNDDAAIYKEGGDDDDDAVMLSVSPALNALTLVLRGRELLSFTKYVSALAPGSKWEVHAEFSLDPSSVSAPDDNDETGVDEQEGDNDDSESS